MEKNKLDEWGKAVDTAEVSLLTENLPKEYPLGSIWVETLENEPPRQWQMLEAVAGKAGSRWAYWSNKEKYQIVVDTIFNGDASHFVGMLGLPFSGKFPGVDAHVWVLISPRLVPPHEIKTYEERPKERYERSREVFDVETGEVKPI